MEALIYFIKQSFQLTVKSFCKRNGFGFAFYTMIFKVKYIFLRSIYVDEILHR